MQPTRQLLRSPIPAIAVSQTPEPYDRYSTSIYGRYFNQTEIQVGSPPPEILQGKNISNMLSFKPCIF